MRDGQDKLEDVERMGTDSIDSEAETVEIKEAKGKEVIRTIEMESTTTNPKTTTLSSRPIPKIQQPTTGSAICSSSSKTPQPPNATSRSFKTSSSKRHHAATIDLDSNSEREGSRTSNKRNKKVYGNQGFLSVGEAMVNVEHIRDAARIRAEKKEERRFEIEKQQRDQHHQVEMQQRDQHHQLQMSKQEEILLRLRLQLQTQEQGNQAP